MKTKETTQEKEAINLGFIVIIVMAFLGAILG